MRIMSTQQIMVSNDSGASTPAATETVHCASDLHKALSVSLKNSLYSLAWTQARKGWHQWPNRGKAHSKYGFTPQWVLFEGDF